MASITKEHIKEALQGLGLKKGDLVLVHSSLSSLGWVEGGADAVIDALLETVESEGTVMMPAFSFSLKAKGKPVFDLDNTPSEVGKITEVFRLRKGVLRSPHLTHSVTALGSQAKMLTNEHSVTPCGQNSPFARLVRSGGYILLLGVDQNVNTTFHSVEESARVDYIKFKDIPGASIRDSQGKQKPLPSKAHIPFDYDFNKMEQIFHRENIIKMGTIGKAIIRRLKAQDLADITLEALKKDRRALLKDGDEKLKIPTRLSSENTTGALTERNTEPV